jgi:hypothetical protein
MLLNLILAAIYCKAYRLRWQVVAKMVLNILPDLQNSFSKCCSVRVVFCVSVCVCVVFWSSISQIPKTALVSVAVCVWRFVFQCVCVVFWSSISQIPKTALGQCLGPDVLIYVTPTCGQYSHLPPVAANQTGSDILVGYWRLIGRRLCALPSHPSSFLLVSIHSKLV